MKQPIKFLLAIAGIVAIVAVATGLSSFRERRESHPVRTTIPIETATTEMEEPWRPEQLLAPADLAATINNPNAAEPMIFSVGPGAVIKGSLDMGPVRDSANLSRLQARLALLPKDAAIVIYCGCCPFVHCPNIRPAFTLLNQMHFTNAKLLNVEHNIKTDWIAMGYPSIQ